MSFGIVLARLPAGVLADRYERRTLLLACNTIGALVLGALSILEASNASGTNALLVAAFLLGSVGSTLAPAENVAIRNFVDADLVPRALALIQSRAGVAMIAGPLAGGVLLRVDAAWVFAADAGTYLVAVGCVALLPAGAGARSEDQPPMKAAVEGLRFLWRSPFLRYGALSATVLNLVFNGLLIVIIASAEDSGAGDLGVGVQTAALGAGALVGSLVAAPVARRLPPGTEHRLFHGCRRRGAARVRDGPRHLGRRPPLLALATAAGPVITVVISATQMRITPPQLQGRVHSGSGFLSQAVAPLGPVLAGASSHTFGLTPTVTCAATAVVLLAISGAFVAAQHGALPHEARAAEARRVEVWRG